eukprot:CAMPEP_0202704034 /NCGR_PEP_ID=MMETSP1385-20130828/16791_1 /ASSEMBLY_ACC=CAM_ASM_000861 /TAXON_ID=933848 /ORGANISM="Elphidium margaritaceum" /LENGTH=476 /DNA_ID=CAMNT_0049361975 /DNA_START=31 /DNA_END=1461 /DNA_ORIENTATION=+
MIGRKRAYEEIRDQPCDQEHGDTDNKRDETQATAQQQQAEQVFSKQLLQIYYDRLFPYQDMFHWLSYFNDPENSNLSGIDTKIWRNREFSFTLKDDIYVRYQSYKSLKDWQDDIRKKCPYKIDIGAMYNFEPSRKKTISSDRFVAEEKELVFDIDISDYDDVRTCCKEAGICRRCWPLMCCGIKVMDHILRRDFGLTHLLWVFSGRRGIHCWCSDDVVRSFDVQQRSCLIDYIKLYIGNEMNQFKVDLQAEKTRGIHDSVLRAYHICVPYFQQCSLATQQVLDTEAGIDYFVNMVRFPDIAYDLRQALLEEIDSTDYAHKWERIESVFEKAAVKAGKSNNGDTLKASKVAIRANLMEMVFSYVYPRLDVEVSRHVNHLLKAPFCIHPKTGKVCSIIDPSKCDEFDPLSQPTLLSLINEYNESGKQKNNGQNSQIGWRDTSLKEIVKTFRTTFLDDLQREKVSKLKQLQQQQNGGWQ